MNKQKGFLRLTLALSILGILSALVITIIWDVSYRNVALINFRDRHPEYNGLADNTILERIKNMQPFPPSPILTDKDIEKFDKKQEESNLRLLKGIRLSDIPETFITEQIFGRDKFLLNPFRWILYPFLTFVGIWVIYTFIRWIVIAFIVRQVIVGFIAGGFKDTGKH